MDISRDLSIISCIVFFFFFNGRVLYGFIGYLHPFLFGMGWRGRGVGYVWFIQRDNVTNIAYTMYFFFNMIHVF